MSESPPLRIATRGSPLALWQARWVAAQLRKAHPELRIELVEVTTQGDQDRSSPLATIGGVGVFTKEIQRAVLDGRADLAVHSLKDLPTAIHEGLELVAVPEREIPLDGLVAPRYGALERLRPGSRVGTGSLRRPAQLLHWRRDLNVVAIRGNVHTRLDMVGSGDLDAVVLALAGLHRLGLKDRITQVLGPPRFLPAVGQGALGLECRADDALTRQRTRAIDDPTTHACVLAERTTLARLEGGCLVPLGAWARPEDESGSGSEGDQVAVAEAKDSGDVPPEHPEQTNGEAIRIRLDVAVLDPEGEHRVAVSRIGRTDDPVTLGHAVASELIDQGAERLLRPDQSGQPSQPE